MKAITLWQPWASFVAHGLKTIETRSWDTRYRGWLAIHAAAQMPAVVVEACRGRGQFAEWLERLGYTVKTLPRGVVVCKAQLVRVSHTEVMYVNAFERRFGDFSAGRYGWELGAIVRYLQPVKAQGHQGLWDWTEPEGIETVQEGGNVQD